MFGVERNIRRIKKGVQVCPFRRKFGTIEKEVRHVVTDREVVVEGVVQRKFKRMRRK